MQSSHLFLGRPLLLSRADRCMAVGKDPSGRRGQNIGDVFLPVSGQCFHGFQCGFDVCISSFLMTPAILLEQSISNTLSFLCASAVTVQVSALYIRTLSTRDSYTLNSVVVVIPIDDHTVCSLFVASAVNPCNSPLCVVCCPIFIYFTTQVDKIFHLV